MTQSDFKSGFVNGLLGIKPLYQLAKSRARKMMIQRAEAIGVPWRDRVAKLKQLDLSQALTEAGFSVPQILPNSPRHRTVIACNVSASL